MKGHYKLIIRAALLSIALFVTGKILFSSIFSFFEPVVDGIFFQVTDRGGKLPTSLLFSFVLSLMPLVILLAWRFGSILSPSRRIYFIIITLALTAAAIFVRHKEVKIYFDKVVRPVLLSQNRLPMQYPINPVNFVYYMIGGFLIGAIISFFLFRQKYPGKKKSGRGENDTDKK